MSGNLLVFAGSLAGVGFLVFVSWALGLGRNARISGESEARELADNAICGFAARTVTLDAAGRGALLQDNDGRILLLAPHGAQFAGRLLEPATRVSHKGGRLTIDGTTLDLGDAAGAWAARLKALDS